MANGPLRESGSLGTPGIYYMKWLAQVSPGDELRVKATVLDTSNSNGIGVLRWRWQVFNQDSIEVLELSASSLFDLKDQLAPAKLAFEPHRSAL